MFITSFKTEFTGNFNPAKLFFEPHAGIIQKLVQERSDYIHHAWNSVVTSFGANDSALIIAIPAALLDGIFSRQNRTKAFC